MTAKTRTGKWWKTTAWFLAALVVAFHLGGGYIFSNMIRADALTPQPPTPDNGVYVRSFDEGLITITSLEERADTMHPGTFGLAWEDGYGRIGGITDIDGLNVTRQFELVAGNPPQPCPSDLKSCDEVDIEGWAYETDPTDVGLDFDEVTYQTPLGRASAWRVESSDGSVWAIHAHGWRASKREAIRTLPTYHEVGITSLVIDYRNDPNAPADPSGLYRFGDTEWQDVDAAVSYAVDHGATEIVLVGYSTGAALHAAFLENSANAGLVRAVVLDSPNLDMGATVQSAAAGMTLPGTPIPVPSTLTWTAMGIAQMRFDVDWNTIDYATRAEELFTVPTLIFHGTEDPRVPLAVSEKVAASSAYVRLIEVPGAAHVTSWNIEPDQYGTTLTEFLVESKDRK